MVLGVLLLWVEGKYYVKMDMFKKAKSKVQATVKEVQKVAEQQQQKYKSGPQVPAGKHGVYQTPVQEQQYGHSHQNSYQPQAQYGPPSGYGPPTYGQQPAQPQSYFPPAAQNGYQNSQQNTYHTPPPQDQMYSQSPHQSPYSQAQNQQYTSSPPQQPHVAQIQPYYPQSVISASNQGVQYTATPPPVLGIQPHANTCEIPAPSRDASTIHPPPPQVPGSYPNAPPIQQTVPPPEKNFHSSPEIPNSAPLQQRTQPHFQLAHRQTPTHITQDYSKHLPNQSSEISSRPLQSLKQCTDGEGELADAIQFYQFSPNVLSPQTNLDPDYDYICEFCFRTKISPYQALISCFIPLPKKLWPSTDSSPPVFHDRYACSLRLPTAQSILYNSCIPQNSIQPLVQFTQNAKAFPVCSGESIPSGQAYYATDRIPDFGLCIPCFETYVKGTSFERKFKQKRDSTGSTWACDLGLFPFIDRWLRTNLRGSSPDFERFVAEAMQRKSLAPCPGELVAIDDAVSGPAYHYGPKEDLAGVYCESCYFDILRDTVLGLDLGHRYLIEDQYKGSLICELASPYSQVVMSVALAKGTAGIWRDTMAKLHGVTACKRAQGVNEGIDNLEGELFEWYALTDYPQIEVCPHCYWTTVKLNGADHLFSPIHRPLKPNFIRQCYLSGPLQDNGDESADVSSSRNFQFTIAWRGKLLRNALSYGYDSKGNFDSLLFTAKKLSNMPAPCAHQLRGFASGSERKFFGRFAEDPSDPDDCTIVMCEECHWDCVKSDSLIASKFTDISERAYTEYIAATGVWCQTYSKLSKMKLSDAAKTGDFRSFARHWNKRAEVKKRYDPWPARVRTSVTLELPIP